MSIIDKILELSKEKGVSQAHICSKIGKRRNFLNEVKSTIRTYVLIFSCSKNPMVGAFINIKRYKKLEQKNSYYCYSYCCFINKKRANAVSFALCRGGI